MGYETLILVGGISALKPRQGTFFQVYAAIDLCKCVESNLLKMENVLTHSTKVFWFPPSGDGNTPVTEDRYGKEPKLISITDAISALKRDVATSDYRRFKWALALLESMYKSSEEDLLILLYGH